MSSKPETNMRTTKAGINPQSGDYLVIPGGPNSYDRLLDKAAERHPAIARRRQSDQESQYLASSTSRS